MLVPRALRVGWNLGAIQDFRAVSLGFAVVQFGALFLAVATAMSIALGFVGLGVPPPTADFGGDISAGRDYIAASARLMMVPGIVVSIVIAIWLAMATLAARSGQRYRSVGWSHVMS